MRMTRKFLGAGVLAVMAGCSSLNPFASKPKGNEPAPLVELKGSMAVRTAWKVEIGKAGNYIFSPALVENRRLQGFRQLNEILHAGGRSRRPIRNNHGTLRRHEQLRGFGNGAGIALWR